jgi:hypothetical protein
LADLLRDHIRLKQKNERLKQKLSLQEPKAGSTAGSSSSNDGSGHQGVVTKSSSSSSETGKQPERAAAAQVQQGGMAAGAPAVPGSDSQSGPPVAAGKQPAVQPNTAAPGAEAGAADASKPREAISSRSSSSSSSASGALSVEDIVQKLQGYKTDNTAMVQALAAQMEEVRGLCEIVGLERIDMPSC